MRTLSVERYEGQYTVCEDSERHHFAIETTEMPKEAVPGTVIKIDDGGIITVDEEETKKKRERIASKLGKLT